MKYKVSKGDKVYVDLHFENGGYVADVVSAGKIFAEIKLEGSEPWTIMIDRLKPVHLERIQCAAIHYDDGKHHPHSPFNIGTGIVVYGLRHCVCIHALALMFSEKEYREKGVEGFLTNFNRFVGRREAGRIAITNKQIEKTSHLSDNRLDSSDLY